MCLLNKVKDIDLKIAREHISIRPIACGLWLRHTHDLLKCFIAQYEPVNFSLEQLWKDFRVYVKDVDCIDTRGRDDESWNKVF